MAGQSSTETKKTIHFFDRRNQLTERINELYQSQFKILRKEQFYSLLIIEGLKILDSEDYQQKSLAELGEILKLRDQS